MLRFFFRKGTLGKPFPKELFRMHWNDKQFKVSEVK